MKGILRAALAAAAVLALSVGASAKETVVWWDFLGGGDGVRMKKLIEDFNNEHKDAIEIQATTLDWGVPFYTKVQTSAAIGEGPDMMTYHTSRIPLAVEQGMPHGDHRRRHEGDGPRRGGFCGGNLGRGPCRRQAVRRPVRYAPDRPLLQQGQARRRRPHRRRRPARRASTASTTSRPRSRRYRTAAPSGACRPSPQPATSSSARSTRCFVSRTARC